jgi:hypothetical protein
MSGERIFSGERSRELWDAIKATAPVNPATARRPEQETHDALYLLGCRCQELEAVVHAILDRLDRQGVRAEDAEAELRGHAVENAALRDEIERLKALAAAKEKL